MSTAQDIFQVNATPSNSNGTLSESFERRTPLTCAGYTFRVRIWYQWQFVLHPGVAKGVKVTYLITDTVKNAAPGPIQFCLGANKPFTTRSGAIAPRHNLPDGTTGYVGLVPSCASKRAVIRCVSIASKGKDKILTVRSSALLAGDPWGGS